MKFFKKMACAAAVAMSVAGAAHAAPVLNGWVFNPNGGGFTAGQTINEYLDVTGNAFIQLTATGGTSFSFAEHAVFTVPYADSNSQSFSTNYTGGNITATFEGYGTGNFSGAFTFDTGVIKIYQNLTNQYTTTAGTYGADQGNLIATFNVLAGGGGMVDASGSPVNNGQVTVNAQAEVGGVAPGYFFMPDGTDMSFDSVLAFAFTNANTLGAPGRVLVSEVACEWAGFTGPGCGSGTFGNTSNAFFVSNSGQFKLAEVPEPGSLALFGIAMLGVGFVSRKRAKKA